MLRVLLCYMSYEDKFAIVRKSIITQIIGVKRGWSREQDTAAL